MKLSPELTKRLLRAAAQVTIGTSIAVLLYAWSVGTISTDILLVVITICNTGLLIYFNRERVF